VELASPVEPASPVGPASPVAPLAAAQPGVPSPPSAPTGDWLSGGEYRVGHVKLASTTSVGAGMISALLGVGGGIINVPTMHLLMGVPLRVAAATSNVMIGVTAVAPAILYLLRGELDPYVAGPTALGVFLGANLGARTAHRVNVRVLRWLFVIVLGYTAFQMARRALGA
jgi:uncharacterized protein